MAALFRKALLPQLDSLAGPSGSSNRHPKTQEEEHGEESVTDSLAMLSAPVTVGSKRGNTKQSSAPASSFSGLMGLVDSDARRTGGTKKQHAKRTTTLASGLGRYVGRPSSRNISSSKGTSAEDSLGNMGSTTATAKTSARRTVDENIEGGVLMSLGNLSLQPATLGRNRSNKTAVPSKLPARTQQHQPEPQRRASQPNDSLAQGPENTASGGLLGFALGTFTSHRNKNLKQSQQAVVPKQSRQGHRRGRGERRRSRSRAPSKHKIVVPQPTPSTKQSKRGHRERGRSRSQAPSKHESAVAFLQKPTKAKLSGGGSDGGDLGNLGTDVPSSKLKTVEIKRNGLTGRTKRQDFPFRAHRKENANLAPAGGLLAAFAAQSISDDPIQTTEETADQPGVPFMDDASSNNSKPVANDIEEQPVKLTMYQQLLARMQGREEAVPKPSATDGVDTSTATTNNGKQHKATVDRESSSFTKEPTKKKDAGHVAKNNKKERGGVLRSPKVSKRRSKRLANEHPATSPVNTGVVLKRRDEKKTPSKLEFGALKQVSMGNLKYFKQSDVRHGDPRREVQYDDESKAAPEIPTAASPPPEADGLYSNSMSPISELGGDDYCDDIFVDAMEIEDQAKDTFEEANTPQDDTSVAKSASKEASTEAAGTSFVDTPQPRHTRLVQRRAGVRGDDCCSDKFPDLVAIRSNLPSTTYEKANNDQDNFCNDTSVDAMEIGDHHSATSETPQPRQMRMMSPTAGVKCDDCCSDTFPDLVAIRSNCNLPSDKYEQANTDRDGSSITKSVAEEPSPNPASNASTNTPQSSGVRSISPISQAGGYSPMVTEPEGVELFSDAEEMAQGASKNPADTRNDKETTRSRRSSRLRVQPDRFGVNNESTEEAASPKRSGIVSTLFKARVQTKSITDVCRGETDNTRPKKNEVEGSAAAKDQLTSPDSLCRANDENLPAPRRSQRARVETDRLGDFADAADELPRSDAAADKIVRRSDVGVATFDQGKRSHTSEREGQQIVSRRSDRPREEPTRFGEYVDFTEDQVETVDPPTDPLPPLDVGKKKSALGFRVIERKMPFMKKHAPRPESISADGWSSLEVTKLREAHGKADSLSDTFWSDVAVRVGEKSALECRDKWFSLVQTPNPRQAKKKKNGTTKKPAPGAVCDEDDIFNSTPMRGELGSGAQNEGSPMRADFGSAIRVDGANATARLSSEYEGTINPIDFQPRAGYKSYLQGMKRDVSRNQKDNKSKKKQGASKQGPRCLSEAVYEEDVDMNARLTPGGTLKLKSMTEGDDDDDFWGEMYGSEDGDEVDSFQ